MGIRFIDTILALVAACAFVFVAYFVGHALASEHAGWAWAVAGALVVVAATVGWLTVRRVRSYARSRGEEPGT